MSNSKLKSQVWSHFTDVDADKKVTCLYCPQSLSVANKSTCSLIRHLKKKHGALQLLRQSNSKEPATEEEEIFIVEKTDDTEFKTSFPTETVIEYEISESEASDDKEAVRLDQKPTPKYIRLKTSQSNVEPEQHVISAMTEAKRHIDEALTSMKSLTCKKQIEELDEYDHFAHMIAAKIRKIQDMDERETVMNSIHNVVYRALMKNI